MRGNFVFDTNTLISAALSPFSKNAEAIIKAESLGIIVYSENTLEEFQNVLFRPKFDRYFSVSSRKIFPVIPIYFLLTHSETYPLLTHPDSL